LKYLGNGFLNIKRRFITERKACSYLLNRQKHRFL